MKKIIILTILIISAFTFSASAQTKSRVKFVKGADSATVKGTLTGYKYVDYVGAKSGQTMTVNLKSSNEFLECYVFDGAMSNLPDSSGGTDWSGALPADDNYTIRVMLPRSAARRKGAAAAFSVKISVE